MARAAAAFSVSPSAGRAPSTPRKPAAAKKQLATPKLSKAALAAVSRRIVAADAAADVPDRSFTATQLGDGSVAAPFCQPLRAAPNNSGCKHCPMAECHCLAFDAAFLEAEDEVDADGMRRILEVAGNIGRCAKSLLAPFVSRMADMLDARAGEDVFYDFGCGNGSILFQMAMVTGVECVGVEICKNNSELARRIWVKLAPKLEQFTGRKMPKVTIITGDITDVVMQADFGAARRLPKVLSSNLVMPKSLTHFMSERFRALPVGSRVVCFDDMYPHARSVAQVRDPEAFALFRMLDYRWPVQSVEWMYGEGEFHMHCRV
jgi:SAM-dependent methyltransferase